MPKDILDEVTQEVIALFGLMMAAVLPTMILTASVLRPGGMSVKKIYEYRNALITQTKVWAGLFIWSLVCCVFVLIGKLTSWSIPAQWNYLIEFQIDLIDFINFIIYFGSTLIISRVCSIVDGIISLIDLSAKISVSEIQEINNKIAEPRADDVLSPPNHGRLIDFDNKIS